MDNTAEGGPGPGNTPSDSIMKGAEDEPAARVDRRHLLVFRGASSSLFPLPASGDVIIGRSEAADVQIDDALVSRQHARVGLEGDVVTISDLGSQKGTYLNEVRLTGTRVLQPNDVITISKTTLIFHTTSQSSPSAVALDMPTFRRRLEDEVDRTVTADRKFSVLCVAGAGSSERSAIQRAVATQLRRVDAAAWSNDGLLYVLLAEAGAEEARAIASRIGHKLDHGMLRIGHMTCPTDAYAADALLAGAYKAAMSARLGEISGTATAQTLTIGNQRVIIADPTVVRLYALIERLAPVSIPVLITGETGCGKELVATAIHTRSHRASKPLISLNCAALHEMLVESELFGHEKGSFSGAIATKAGLIEAADGSTLFLDEIGELAPGIQAKLLRVLESRRVTRVGDVRERAVDVRIVAATNRDLEADVVAGRFRRDLFFRLSAATLDLPPLRQRSAELPLLAVAFLDEACRLNSRGAMRISDGAMAVLLAHSWPGNIRELKNLMQYISAAHPVDIVLAEHVSERLGRLRPSTAPAPQAEVVTAAGSHRFRPIADELRELEITRIREALEATAGNQTRAAALIAMPVRTFFEKAKQYGLTPKKKRYDH
ncbi:MAG TPA: sigma 54-interacting transcriptional regulator [Kofleriaceae bacterium]|nr:sigma 54-interacting transcriptional regulator [Kofleriaceae bacterium]